MTYKLPKSAREYVLYQRTELLPKRQDSLIKRILIRLGLMSDDYKKFVKAVAMDDALSIDERYFASMKEKVDSLIGHIPEQTSSILDIGCGIAALDVYLNQYLNPSNIYLLDKTETEEKIWYLFEDAGAFYNSLELSKETLELNGVASSKIELIEAPSDGEIPLGSGSIDLVISTISWGFHYPINIYVKSVFNLLSKDGVLIVDLRKDSGGLTDLKTLFNVEIIEQKGKVQTVKCTKK